MSRFLRNAIVSARDPGASLQPRVPSLYADLGGRGQDALEVEPPMADGVTSTRDGLEGFAPPARSKGSSEGKRIGRRRHGQHDESMRGAGEPEGRSALDASDPAPGALLPRIMDEITRVHGPLRHAPATPRDDGQRASNTRPGAPPPSDADNAAAEMLRPRLARSSREDSGDGDARGPLEPSLRELWHIAEARSQPVAAPSQRMSDVESRGPRAGPGRSSAPSNDVEIHIGRIEVIAAVPAVRAPPKITHKSPSLGDYLNGRRGRRP